jgi:hypothetical protein
MLENYCLKFVLVLVVASMINDNFKMCYRGKNYRISASWDNASSATLRVAAECYIIHETFSYMLKRSKHFGDRIATYGVMTIT